MFWAFCLTVFLCTLKLQLCNINIIKILYNVYDLYKLLNLDIFIKYSKSIKDYLKSIEITQNHLNCYKDHVF